MSKKYQDDWAKWVSRLAPADMARVEVEIDKVRAAQRKAVRTDKWLKANTI